MLRGPSRPCAADQWADGGQAAACGRHRRLPGHQQRAGDDRSGHVMRSICWALGPAMWLADGGAPCIMSSILPLLLTAARVCSSMTWEDPFTACLTALCAGAERHRELPGAGRRQRGAVHHQGVQLVPASRMVIGRVDGMEANGCSFNRTATQASAAVGSGCKRAGQGSCFPGTPFG